MNPLTPKEIRAKRAAANQLSVTVHVGKDGVSPALVEEMERQLKGKKLVKVRLLPAATEGGAGDQAQAEALAEATRSALVEVRGHTAVYWRA